MNHVWAAIDYLDSGQNHTLIVLYLICVVSAQAEIYLANKVMTIIKNRLAPALE
ncbi:hypothetical protein [Legionella oakridgensis]|uniref:Uncharacterized protein n=1 Tax=Legionella oakridgensis ATCC 33761 = DSM 21215 TaxID=1268635 RepID=W0BDY0_9GAMM|nr:hypothetical protein [Legionella oakridgensis]AHE66624.1 hypothetical protein Loa_01068 [Legionella oakridgensis ATCC 33761 = DSM 21215]